ncbi:hypothetical protein CRG95_16990 [Escherichia sp. E4208]|uniref:dCTP deaminase domain-containing protein n=1 Tax=Escherichia sp. E4208 TaxID=2044463 RepID=UPI00107F455E|nr:hypothetical protein [Escherichia sp. E4208]TGB83007.1 hypothetical protein CRG95_16990 [Escherichia sp. E4208]
MKNSNLQKNLAGVIFPRNTLSKNGIIMTNPGHIDPGYNGIISIYLVNMSKEPFSLTQNSAVARMLLFKTIIPTKGYQGKIVNKLDDDQLSRMGKDFAGLDKRLPKEINKIIAKKNWLYNCDSSLNANVDNPSNSFLISNSIQ